MELIAVAVPPIDVLESSPPCVASNLQPFSQTQCAASSEIRPNHRCRPRSVFKKNCWRSWAWLGLPLGPKLWRAPTAILLKTLKNRPCTMSLPASSLYSCIFIYVYITIYIYIHKLFSYTLRFQRIGLLTVLSERTGLTKGYNLLSCCRKSWKTLTTMCSRAFHGFFTHFSLTFHRLLRPL